MRTGGAGQTAEGKFLSFYTKGEEIFNAVSHIVGGGLSLIFWATLLAVAYPSPAALLGVSLFGLGAVTLYTMSAIYHFLPDGRAKGVMRIFDHCTIFLLIAGTYSPYCLVALGGTTAGWIVLGLQWGFAVVGIVMNAVALDNKVVKAVSMALYCIMGWMALPILPQLFAALTTAQFALLLAGGLAYTAGIAFYALGRKLRWFHSVWHLFDIAGTVLQFASILLMLL